MGLRQRSQQRLVAAACTLFTLAAGVFAAVTSPFWDEEEYWGLAETLVEHGSYGVEPTAARAPGVPFVLTLFDAVGLDLETARIVFSLLLLVVAWIMWIWLRKLSVVGAPLAIATVLAIANPALVATAGSAYPQLLVAVLLSGAIFLVTGPSSEDRASPGWRTYAAAGVLAGASLLVAPNTVFPVAGLIGWLMIRSLRQAGTRRMLLGRSAILVLFTALVLTPWVWRNYAVTGEFPVITTQGGYNLLLGNSPATQVNTGVEIEFAEEDQTSVGMTEVEADAFQRERAIAHITEDPTRYAWLYVGKVGYGVWPDVTTATRGTNGPGTLLQRGYYLIVYLGLVAWAVLSNRYRTAVPWVERAKPYFGLVLGMTVANVLGSAIFVSRLRYRLPTDVPLAAYAGLGLFLLVLHVSRSSSRSPEAS